MLKCATQGCKCYNCPLLLNEVGMVALHNHPRATVTRVDIAPRQSHASDDTAVSPRVETATVVGMVLGIRTFSIHISIIFT